MIELKNITVKFGSLIANNNISIKFQPGEIHTLLGENGAGKSTLISILQGIITPNKGKVIVEEKEVKMNPKRAKDLGIYVLPQHFNIIENTTVLDNIIASSLDKSSYLLNRSDTARKVESIIKRYNIEINLKEQVSNLTIGQKQMIEIIRMLYRDSSVLVLDEPTAILNKKEIENLLKMLKILRKEKRTIVFISHKLEEVLEISDVISVLRKGKLQSSFKNSKLSKKHLVEAMIGNQKPVSLIKKKVKVGEQILSLNDISVEGKNKRRTLKDINLNVHEGEIVGIAAIDGNGEEELVSIIAGTKETKTGKINFFDKDITHLSIKEKHHLGFAYVPANTNEEAIAKGLPIFTNLILNTSNKKEYYRYKYFFDFKKGKAEASKIIKNFDIRGVTSINKLATQLSGGNLQKVVVGREMSANAKLLVLSEPTKGLDVNAINNIYNKVLEYKTKGRGVILYSSEIQELVNVCDRVYVLKEGRISGMLKDKITEDKIMNLLI